MNNRREAKPVTAEEAQQTDIKIKHLQSIEKVSGMSIFKLPLTWLLPREMITSESQPSSPKPIR